MRTSTNDTIVAPATPLQVSAIGVIRLSGPDSLAILRRICSDLPERPVARRMYLQWLREPHRGETLDQAQVVTYKAPHSYTGEDMAEIFLHGSPVVVRRVTDTLIALGGRYARPGEFSERAVLNGKMDLIQAEGVNDLIEAVSPQAANQALLAVAGKISQYVVALQDKIMNILAELYAILDFPEDDIEPVDITAGLERLIRTLSQELERFRHTMLVKNGVQVVIAGPPNAGKSTLFNRLIGHKRTIIADLPGTTRDVIEERVMWGGIPIILKDTGGIGVTEDVLNDQVQQATNDAIRAADILVLLGDGRYPEDIDVGPQARKIMVVNKADLPGTLAQSFPDDAILISASSGQGLEHLKSRILKHANELYNLAFHRPPIIAGYRQYEVMLRVYDRLNRAVELLSHGEPEELSTLELEAAVTDIGELTGAQISEEVLSRIFDRFCIGK